MVFLFPRSQNLGRPLFDSVSSNCTAKLRQKQTVLCLCLNFTLWPLPNILCFLVLPCHLYYTVCSVSHCRHSSPPPLQVHGLYFIMLV